MVVCILASAGLAVVFNVTAERIKENERKELQLKLKEVLPGADRFEETGERFIGYKADAIIGTAVKLSPKGYSGPIRFLLGIDPSLKVLGIAILTHKETPGLGKKIENNKFRDQFAGKGADKLFLTKDSPEGVIHAITAATISSRAVTKAVREALKKYNAQPGAMSDE